MTNAKNEIALTMKMDNTELRYKTSQVSPIQRAEAGAANYVSHVSIGQVKVIAVVASQNSRHGEPNALLIKFQFDGCLRVSEGLGIRPCDLEQTLQQSGRYIFS